MSNNASCNNSIIDPSICVQGAGGIGSKIAITVNQDYHGFSAGTAVRWDSAKNGNTAGYKPAQANNAYNAEVLGIVSSVLSQNSFELTLSGVVRMNDFFSNTTGSIPGGKQNDDVFFLSGYTAGWLDIQRPTQPGWVAKPIITRFAEDVNGNIFGSVINYVGAINGGNIATSLGQIVPVGTLQAWLGQFNKVPHGWALCDGEGFKDGNGVPGISVSKYPEYNSTVGKEYGWVECIYTGNTSLTDGDRIRQTVNSGQKQIVGTVVGASGGINEDGKRYLFVRQSVQEHNVGESVEEYINNNFAKIVKDSTLRGGYQANSQSQTTEDNAFYYLVGVRDFHEFEKSDVGIPYDIIKESGEIESGSVLFQDKSKNAGTFSILTPDLREKFVRGGKDESQVSDPNADGVKTRGEIGGNESFNLGLNNSILGYNGYVNSDADNQANYVSQSTLPPYVTANWIVRVDPNASAAVIDLLEIKDLKLTDLPTSSSGQDPNTIFNDNGTLKIV